MENNNVCQCPHGLVPHFYEKGDKYVKEAR